MELYLILIIYVIVLVCLVFAFFKSGIRFVSSLILAMIISQILLIILKPPSSVNYENEDLSIYAFYIFIQVVTVITIYFYVIITAANDKNNRICKLVPTKTSCCG
jgi:energy-coupling factor transporter transmembrane protein EcfT